MPGLFVSIALLLANVSFAMAMPLPTATAPDLLVRSVDCEVRIDGPSRDDTSKRHVRRDTDCKTSSTRQRRRPRQPADCHRDARTHRVGGVRLRHRHVGDKCTIREVRAVN